MPMMKCGHSANGFTELPGGERKPCCVICSVSAGADEIDETPNLEGRIARCGCGNETASRTDLAFFRYYPEHDKDEFYCGCSGWDQQREKIKMELTEIQAKIVKEVYSNYHAGELPADEALNILEQLINGNEVCQSCLPIITDENPLIDTERYTANDYTGYCENCYDPTP